MKLKNLMMGVCLSLVSVAQAAFVNDPAPDFALKDMSGVERKLSDYKGEVVLVNFWASWCPPCKKEFPELAELANEYKDHKFRVLAINLDKSQEQVAKFLAKTAVKPGALIILLDPAARVVANYVARSMPSSFIVDSKGIIRFVHFGYGEKDPAKWRTEIDQLLAELKTKAELKK